MKNSVLFKEFFRYSTLSVLGILGVSCYILADTFFIAKGMGTDGLTALNLALPAFNFTHGTGIMLGMGGATKFAVAKSRNQNADKIYTNTVYAAAVFSVVFMLIGLFFTEPLASFLGAEGRVHEMTSIYLKWLLLFSPAFIMNEILLCFVRNDSSPQLPMIAMITGSFMNILLDYIFIFPFDLGIFGAILATGLSPIISIILMSPHWIKKKNTFHFKISKPDFPIVGSEISLGAPSFLAQVSSGIIMIVFNSLILSLEGNTGVAAYGVVANIAFVVMAVFTGISQGVQPLLSRYHGVGNPKSVRTIFNYSAITTIILSAVFYLILFIYAEPITAVFNSENNPVLQSIAVAGLKLYFVSTVFSGLNTLISVFFTSIEKALPAQILSVLRGLVMIIPITFLLSAIWKMTGIWLAYPITEILVAVLGVILYLKQHNHKTKSAK